VAQIEIGLSPVISDEDFTMLKRVHSAGVDVDIWVQLLNGYPQPSAFHQSPNGGCSKALTQGRKDPTRDEDEFWLAQSVVPYSAIR
jgi:hypothetical protein